MNDIYFVEFLSAGLLISVVRSGPWRWRACAYAHCHHYVPRAVLWGSSHLLEYLPKEGQSLPNLRVWSDVLRSVSASSWSSSSCTLCCGCCGCLVLRAGACAFVNPSSWRNAFSFASFDTLGLIRVALKPAATRVGFFAAIELAVSIWRECWGCIGEVERYSGLWTLSLS